MSAHSPCCRPPQISPPMHTAKRRPYLQTDPEQDLSELFVIPSEIRFVLITTQSARKRLRDIVNTSTDDKPLVLSKSDQRVTVD